jgi:site-specific DNA-methyltransferase (adenine-specific)
LTISPAEAEELRLGIEQVGASGLDDDPGRDRLICGDAYEILKSLTPGYGLLFADPPYNLSKTFGSQRFSHRPLTHYEDWLGTWLKLCVPLLTPTASVYLSLIHI